MVQISITRDEETGRISGVIIPENKTLEDYFETEIQNDMAVIRHIRKKLPDAEEMDVDISGNAYCLTLGRDQFTIMPLFDKTAAPVSGPMGEFLYLLDQWYAFLLSNAGDY